MKYPDFLINRYRKKLFDISSLPHPVNTVCESAKCPNRGECFQKKTVTFLLLGDICTRDCRFCGVKKGPPESTPDDIEAILSTVSYFDLQYVVLTSVTRDDLPDGGASVFRDTLHALHNHHPDIKIEVLIPDFKGNRKAIDRVCYAEPNVFNHNLEVVQSIFSDVRPSGSFDRSLDILKYVKENYVNMHIKTGIMVGLGEREDEVLALIDMLADIGIHTLTIGQYLQPDKTCAPVVRIVTPPEYQRYIESGRRRGIRVVAGPLVRSSYLAEEVYCNSSASTISQGVIK